MTVVLALVLATDVGKGIRERLTTSGGSRQNMPLPRIESIAVLPLDNLSHDPEQEYFADGMTDALITDLGKFGALRVISRTSIMRYKATKKPLPEIGRELNVDAIVEGTVQRSGNRVRITANLLHAPTDRHLWADAYESEMQDVLMLQSEVARSIASEIEVTVTPSEQLRVASAPPVNPEAYQAYLKGRYYLNQTTEEGMKKAVEYLKRAIGIDASYAVAYAGLAEAYGFLGGAGMEVLTPAEGYGKSKAAALKALEIDEGVAEAHTMLANVKSQYDWDFPGAEKEYRRAIELNPNDALARVYYGQLLELIGRHQEAIVMTTRAVELDPLTPLIHANLVYRYLMARLFDKAIEEGRKAIADEPNFWMTHLGLGRAYEQKGMFREALAELEKAVDLSSGNAYAKGALGHGYAVADKNGDAQRIIEEFDKQSKTKHVPSYCRAEIYAGLGEKDRAFFWLQQAHKERCGELVRIKIDPTFDGLRSDPKFQDLLRRMNFPPP